MNPLKEIFIENFVEVLNSIGVDNPQKEEYIIVQNTEDERWTTMDERYRLWETPSFSGIKISYDSVIGNLVKEHKKLAPLWIKVYNEKDKPIMLHTSKRYRKLRDINLRRRDNELAPFEIAEEPFIDFSASKERSEAIRVIFFTQEAREDLKQTIGDSVAYKEVHKTFKNYFDTYRFYPPTYKQTNAEGEEADAFIVIEKDFATKKFTLFKSHKVANKLQSNLDLEEVLRFYLKEVIKYDICGISIKS